VIVRVYIDGFNFYYRLFKNSNRIHQLPPALKWLDVRKLSVRLAPGQTIDWVGYFTAPIVPNQLDPDQHIRQRAYLSALETLPNVEVVRGSFRKVEKRGIQQSNPGQGVVAFDTYEEKGSDVNLGVRLVWDAARGAFDSAIVVSNDSDLADAIRIVTSEIGKTVYVHSPDVAVNNALRPPVSTKSRPIDTKHFKFCRLPDPVVTSAGVLISCPARWK
jgi:hypothetical protein